MKTGIGPILESELAEFKLAVSDLFQVRTEEERARLEMASLPARMMAMNVSLEGAFHFGAAPYRSNLVVSNCLKMLLGRWNNIVGTFSASKLHDEPRRVAKWDRTRLQGQTFVAMLRRHVQLDPHRIAVLEELVTTGTGIDAGTIRNGYDKLPPEFEHDIADAMHAILAYDIECRMTLPLDDERALAIRELAVSLSFIVPVLRYRSNGNGDRLWLALGA